MFLQILYVYLALWGFYFLCYFANLDNSLNVSIVLNSVSILCHKTSNLHHHHHFVNNSLAFCVHLIVNTSSDNPLELYQLFRPDSHKAD